MKNNFSDIWERVRKNAGIKNLIQLSEVVETSQPNVSKKKKENKFPVEWAYKIEKKYGLLTNWIMTGESPKSIQDIVGENRDFKVIADLENWLREYKTKEPGAMIWFELEVKRKFPEFEKWVKRENN